MLCCTRKVRAVIPELSPVEHVEASVATANDHLAVALVNCTEAVQLALVHLRLHIRLLSPNIEAVKGT
jgi:hypothetical protein